MKEYNPFARGSFPAGVNSLEFIDQDRSRTLPVECWYPATGSYQGKDLDQDSQDQFILMPGFPKMRQAAVRAAEKAEGIYPLVIFSHGLAGHRRQTSHFCAHLASHGYIVASMDHMGNTMPEILQMALKAQKQGNASEVLKELMNSARDRPIDAVFTVDMILAGEMGSRIDPSRIGITGHSFGGWTTLAATGLDSRFQAAIPLAPAGGRSRLDPMSNFFSKGLTLDWNRRVPILFLTAELDSLLPLDGMKDLFARTPQPKDMVILGNADHFHFCDGVEQTHDLFRKMGGLTFLLDPSGKAGMDPMKKSKPSSELCPGKDAYLFLQGLGLAHMDAHLKGNPDALAFLKGDLQTLLAGRGITAEVLRG